MATTTAPLGYLAHIIYQSFELEHSDPAYLAGKRERLADLDKFHSLLFLSDCGEAIQMQVARKIGVTLAELQTTINVLQHC